MQQKFNTFYLENAQKIEIICVLGCIFGLVGWFYRKKWKIEDKIMSTPMMNQARRLLDALQEGKIIAAIAFAQDLGWSADILRDKLEKVLEMSAEDIDYWFEEYKIDEFLANSR